MFDLGGYLKSVIKYGYTTSALAPLLWLNALISVPSLILFAVISNNCRWALLIIAIIVIIFTLNRYNYLLKLDPKWLQSERYQFEARKLDLISKKGGDIIFEPKELVSPVATEPANESTNNTLNNT